MIQLYRFWHISLYAFRRLLLSSVKIYQTFPSLTFAMLTELTQMLKLEPLQYKTMAPLRKSYTTSVHTTGSWKDSKASWSSESCASGSVHNFRPFLQINLTKGKKYHTLNVPFVPVSRSSGRLRLCPHYRATGNHQHVHCVSRPGNERYTRGAGKRA
jgi:hypothetical protein